ncbi:MAG: pseudouridine-5'-phosphate glycosidase [Solobacterium sp.]|jgi:pseudouridine-5'-phosphate glycosidase|nr:pseudouridine-5'-phosphate glycosidase [Solobacterium sp.]MCH4049560.1 pseudouridine-5'-phosphate glycosidase [Solobacterium sp.]MCH4073244.1 pseudouridine-5'-phosphate glycosidase [Solobacterium sp.]MCI1314124.1 pseudouridine-5'-phosphate glycosidase [Solobacterium sp.]MCI1347163.1 pseudouridine-5'-phosphate glycosidase [Solobacterium sp.]
MSIRVNPEVQKALDEGRPVIALESTIISHGMPYPQNVETANKVEQIIRDHGCVPATVGIVDGVGVVGLNKEEIEEMGKRGHSIPKVSRRDLPIVMAEKSWGATTVATTMILASKAGVEFFVTGGIGGVHRGAQETFDISADLEELQNTNVTVICAGAKAILDLRLTMEVLETKGVPVLGYQTEDLPAFYCRKNSDGLKVDYAVKDPEDAARIVKAKRDLGLTGGILITNPIPEEYAMDNAVIDKVIADAIKEMDEKGIHGKECTPFLLAKVAEITGGNSLNANIHLVFNNAAVGSEIAKAYSKL